MLVKVRMRAGNDDLLPFGEYIINHASCCMHSKLIYNNKE